MTGALSLASHHSRYKRLRALAFSETTRLELLCTFSPFQNSYASFMHESKRRNYRNTTRPINDCLFTQINGRAGRASIFLTSPRSGPPPRPPSLPSHLKISRYHGQRTPSRKAGGILRVSANQSDSALVWRMSELTRDGTAEPACRGANFSGGANGDREINK